MAAEALRQRLLVGVEPEAGPLPAHLHHPTPARGPRSRHLNLHLFQVLVGWVLITVVLHLV